MPAPRRVVKNGAKSRGPKTKEGKARSAQNALRHGMRALQYVVLPDEDAVQFQALEAALLDELAPEGALQLVLARRVAVAAWRLARADRMEVELFEERRWEDAGVGMALIRDGNGTRSFETLLRYRSAAMAEFWRALKTLKALQAEPAAVLEQAAGADLALELPVAQLAAPVRAQSPRPAARRAHADRSRTERTRAPHGIRAARAAHRRPRPARAGGIRAASPRTERTRDGRPRRRRQLHPERQPEAALRLDPTCRCSSRARRCSARSEVRFLNLGLSRFRSGSGRPDHRGQWPRRSVDGPLAVRGERVSSPRA